MMIRFRVHIIPVGKDDLDRYQKTISRMKPDKIYLLTFPKGEDAYKKKCDKIQEFLQDEMKLKPSEIIIKREIFYHLKDLMLLIAEICHNEKTNEIYYYISGGTMISIAGTLAVTLFGVIPYFIPFDYLTNQLTDDILISPISNFFIEKPDEEQIKLMKLISNKMMIKQSNKIKKSEIIKILEEHSFSGFKNSNISIDKKKSASYNRLNNRYLKKMISQEIIQTDLGSQGEIFFTKKGKFMMDVFSIFYGSN